jgi:hypothetical protein
VERDGGERKPGHGRRGTGAKWTGHLPLADLLLR